MLNPEALHLAAPDVCPCYHKVEYKPDKGRLRVLLQSEQAERLRDMARLEERIVVEPERRKSAKVVCSEG